MWLLLFLTTATVFAGQFATSLNNSYLFVISAAATDSSGNTYVTGKRQLNGLTGVFLSKLDPNGRILFTDTFGGSGTDSASAVAVDASGNIYIAGTAGSLDFPVSHALQAQPGVGGTGFILKLSNDGSKVLYSTYFGGTLGASSVSSIAIDAQGNLYVTGNTSSSDFPQNSGLPTVQFDSSNGAVASGTIVAEVSAAGDKILYSGLILTGPIDSVYGRTGIAVDAAGNAYVEGDTANPDLPVTTTGAPARTGVGPFVAKINAAGDGFGYLMYVPGSIVTSAIAADASGDVYLAGYGSNVPTTSGSVQPTLLVEAGAAADADGFVAKLSPSGSAFLWATYIPSECGPLPQSMSVDAGGNVWTVGVFQNNCSSPNINGWTTGQEFLIGLNAAGSSMIYSATYPDGTVAQTVAVDSTGVVHVGGAGGFVSAVSPDTPPAMEIFGLQNAFGGSLTSQISPAEVIAIYGPGIGPALAAAAAPASGFYPTTLGGVQVLINGVNAPLLYVSANQINAVAPMELSSNAAAAVHVVNGTAVSADYPIWILPSSPVANTTVLNQDGTVNTQANPAHGGSIVTFWATGWQSNFPLTDGQVQSVANNDACTGGCQAGALFTFPTPCLGFCFALPAKHVDGPLISVAATVAYAGAAPGMPVGVTQFNVQLGNPPASSATYLFSLSIANASSTVSEGVYIAP